MMGQVVTPEHAAAATRVRALLAKYQEVELLVQIGEYRAGQDALADAAIEAMPALQFFLGQQPRALQPMAQTLAALQRYRS